jgi:YidC/Oxa1 family membrane protein insertase
MTSLFTDIIYRPILSLTVFVYNLIGLHDLGLAIIVMTIVIRILVLPLSLKAARSQKSLAEVAPEIDRLKEHHKGDTTAQSEAIMKLYKERGVNPLAGCLPLLIQLPILIGMYRVFLNIFRPNALAKVYSFIPHSATIDHTFLGLMDISHRSMAFAVCAGVLQFIQARLATRNQPQSGQAAIMNQQMLYLFPVMIIVISWNLPAGLALYWITTTLFAIGEQLYLRRR